MTTTDFTTTVLVDQTPKEVFDAINNVRAWWSEEIEGNSNQLNDVFKYHFEDIHRCKIKIVEFIPNKKVVWLVLENYFKFTKDKSEWTGTKINFDISKKENKTQLRFTHEGLIPDYECFEICVNAWTDYIGRSLRKLITTGKGTPNSNGNPTTKDEEKLGSAKNKSREKNKEQDYRTGIIVNATMKEAFGAINSVAKWWTENVEGNSLKLNDEFKVGFGTTWKKFKIVEFVPDKKVVWQVTDCFMPWNPDKTEWTGTKINFEISKKGGNTHVEFTHVGLVPGIDCFDACSNAWNEYLHGSLTRLINNGEGRPEPKEKKAKPGMKVQV